MYEIEVKIRIDCNSIPEIIDKAIRLGGRITGKQREEDVYYQHPCRNFLETDEALRVRVVDGKKYSLTYKGPRIESGSNVKKRVEVIVDILSGDVGSLLERLGFYPVVKVVKDRVYVELGDITLTLDKVEYLGCFVEVEGRDPTSINNILDKLNIKGEYVEETYAEMIAKLKGLI